MVYIWGAVHLGMSSTFGDVSVLGVYTMSTFVGRGKVCIVGTIECIGGYHQCHNNSDIPPWTAHMSLRVKIVTQFKNNLFLII